MFVVLGVVRLIVIAAAVAAAAALWGSGKQDKRLGRMELIAEDAFVFGSVTGNIGPWRFCPRA